MSFTFHPAVFGIMALVAIGTVVYSIWNSESQHQQAHKHSNQGDRPQHKVLLKDQNECTICCDTMVGRKTLKCGHTFHINCIDKWLKTAPYKTCPMCRRTAI